LLYLPEPFTDFIFSILGEELGFLGAIFVMIMFFIILWRGLNISAKISDPYGSILAAGITLNIVVTAMINIGVVCGLLPTTGLPLPFISYGGSSLLFTLASCGVLLNIGRSYGGVSKEVIT
ncbi:FtsW/RodA/SpoVE family cell cycle protein, partial [candidate division KSB1 bacterium]